MAEKETNKIILSSAYEYTRLYRYVFAIRDLQKKGKCYARAKEIIPDIDERLKKGTVKDYNEVIFEAQGAFPGLEGVSKKDLNKLAVYARNINSDKSFPPTIDQVNECKKEYDKRLVSNHAQTVDELKTAEMNKDQAKRNLNKARGKLAGSVLLGILAVGGLAALGVGFAAGIVSVVSSAIAGSVAGIASGFALGGVILGIVGAKLIFNGITKVFKSVINNIKKHNQVRREAKAQYKECKNGYEKILSRMRQLDNQIYADRVSQSDDLTKYPGDVPEPDYLKMKEKSKGKELADEDNIENVHVVNRPQTEAERQAQLNEYLKDREKKYAEFENDYGDEEKRKELDPDNPNDREILNYFEEKQKFYKEFDQAIFPMNPISTSTPTTAQINARYSSDVQKVVDEQFREYMKGVDMHSQTGGEFDSEKLRKECLEKAEVNVKKVVEQNIKEFESSYEDKGYDVPDNASSDIKKLIAADKVIETIENAKKAGVDLDDEVVKEQLKQIDNENVVPEVVAREINPEEIVVEKEEDKEVEETTKRKPGDVGFGTKDAEIDPSHASLDMRSPEDRLILYRHVLGLMEEFENPKTPKERKAELQAKINKYKEKFVVLESAKDANGLRKLIAAAEAKVRKDSGKDVKAENEGPKVPYEQAVEAVKGFSEITPVAGAKGKESSQLAFALNDSTDKEILAIGRKGDEYVLINQNGVLESKDINSIEDVKKFVSETIKKAKEVKAENVSYDDALNAVKGFSELSVVGGEVNKSNITTKFSLDGKNILTLEKKGDKYTLIGQDGALSSKDIKSVEDVKKFVSETIKKAKEVKAENVPYEDALNAVKGFSEITPIAGAKDKESSQLKFALQDSTDKEIITIEKKGNEYVLINQNGTLESKDIKSVEDVKKFVSETIEKAKEVKAENEAPKKEEPKVVEVDIDRRKAIHKRFLSCFESEEAAQEFISKLPKEKQAELKELLSAKTSKENADKVEAFVNENRQEATKEEPKKEEVAEEKEELDSTRNVREDAKTIKIENSLGLDNTTNKAYAEMIWRFDGHDKFNKVVARLSEEERKEVVSILNDPEVLENPKSPKVEKAYEILRKHRLDMEKELTDKDKEKQQEENETGGFEDALAICRSIDGLKETSNESKTVFKFSYKGKLCIILQKTSTDYRMAFMAENEDILKYIIKYPREIIKPSAPKGDNWLLHINKGHFPISQMRTIIEKADQTLKRLLREAGLDKEDEEPSNSNEPKDKTLKSKGPKKEEVAEEKEEPVKAENATGLTYEQVAAIVRAIPNTIIREEMLQNGTVSIECIVPPESTLCICYSDCIIYGFPEFEKHYFSDLTEEKLIQDINELVAVYTRANARVEHRFVVDVGTNDRILKLDMFVWVDKEIIGTEKEKKIHDEIKAEIEKMGIENAYSDQEKARKIIVNILKANDCGALYDLRVEEYNVAKELEEKVPEAEQPAQPKPTKTQRGVQKIIDNKLAKLREKGIEVDVESMTEEELNEFRRDMQTHTHEQLKKLLPEKYSSYVTTKETSKKEQSQEENEEVVQEEKDLSNFEKVEKRLGFELKFDGNVSEEEKENIKEWINNMTEEELEKFIKELKEKGVTKIKVKIPQPEEEDEPGQE